MSLSFNLCLSVTSVFVCGASAVPKPATCRCLSFLCTSRRYLAKIVASAIANGINGMILIIYDNMLLVWSLKCDTYPPEIWGSPTWSFPFVLSSFMLNWSLLLCSLFISVHLFFCSNLGIWVADVTWCYYSAELFGSRYDPWAFNFYWFPRFTVSDAYDRIGRHALPSRHGFPGRNQAWLHSRGTQNFCEIKGNVIRLVEFALNFSKAFDKETLFVSYIYIIQSYSMFFYCVSMLFFYFVRLLFCDLYLTVLVSWFHCRKTARLWCFFACNQAVSSGSNT